MGILNKKSGQSAMEFLMTYGWAILAMLVSLVALAYFGVLNPGLLIPESCILFPGLACTDFAISNDGTMVTVVMRNGIGSPITISDADLVECPLCTVEMEGVDLSVGSYTIAEGQEAVLTFTSPGDPIVSAGEKLKSDIGLQYTIEAGVQHIRSGSINTQAPPSTTSTSTSTSTTSTILLDLNPIIDTYIDQELPTSSFGSASILKLRGGFGAFDKEMYFKFNVAGITGKTIQTATLYLKSNGEDCTTGANCIQIYHVSNAQVTNSMTWNSVHPTLLSGILAARTPVNTNTWYTFNVKSVINNDGAYSFGALITSNGDQSTWYSANSANDPRLVIAAT